MDDVRFGEGGLSPSGPACVITQDDRPSSQILGNIGGTKNYPVESIFRRLRLYRIVTSMSEIQCNTIAKEILAGARTRSHGSVGWQWSAKPLRINGRLLLPEDLEGCLQRRLIYLVCRRFRYVDMTGGCRQPLL